MPYELRIGVTGHRDLANPEGVQLAVRRVLDHIERVLASELVWLHWTIVSPLASGADRIVARCVLERPGAQLEVLTPFPVDEYEKDFQTGDERAEFRFLCSQAREVVPPKYDLDRSKRDLCYREVGRGVVRGCEVLIAVWDGSPPTALGGTADIIDYAVSEGRLVIWIDPSAEASAHVLVRRGRWRGVERGPNGYARAPLPEKPRHLSVGFEELVRFLSSREVSASRLARAEEGERRRLLADAERAGLGSAALRPTLFRVLPIFVRAEQLADAMRVRHLYASIAIFILSATAVSVAVVRALHFHESEWLLVAELAAPVAVLVCLFLNLRRRWHDRWIHYRYLTEQLRAAMYCLVLGKDLKPKMLEAARLLLFYGAPAGWIASTLRRLIESASQEQTEPRSRDLQESARTFVIDGWLMEQKAWHAGNARRKERLHQLTRGTAVVLYGITVLMAAAHVPGFIYPASALQAPDWLTSLAITLPAWAGAIHGIGKQFAYERLSARSGEMARALEDLAISAHSASIPAGFGDVVAQATWVIGLETFEWSVLLRFEPPEIAG